MLLHTPINSLLGSFGDVKKVERLYQSLKFIAGFAVEINETTLFDDIVLPFPSYLERYDFNTGPGNHPFPRAARTISLAGAPAGRRARRRNAPPAGSVQEIADRLGHPGRHVPAREP